jgi:hypothetical protein
LIFFLAGQFFLPMYVGSPQLDRLLGLPIEYLRFGFGITLALVIAYICLRRLIIDLNPFSERIEQAGKIDVVPDGVEIQVLRGIDDEASLTLGIASSIGRLTDLIVGFVLPLTRLASAAFLITGFPILVEAVLDVTVPARLLEWSLYLAPPILMGVFVVSFLGCVGISALPIAKSFFGRELFWVGLQFDIAANSAPDVIGSAQICTLPATTAASRHALYSNPYCLQQMSSFITGDRRDSRQAVESPDPGQADTGWRRLLYVAVFGVFGMKGGPDYGRSSWGNRDRK